MTLQSNLLTDQIIANSLPSLIEYIRTKLGYKQNAMSAFFNENSNRSMSPSTISILKKGDSDKGTTNGIYFRLIIEIFNINTTIGKTVCTFSDGIKDDKISFNSSTKASIPTFFETPKGNIWKVFVHIGDRVGIRYLKILTLKKIEYIIDSKAHDNFIGTGRFNTNYSFLLLDLTAGDGAKDLHMRFYMSSRTAKPEIMLGILVHNVLQDNKIICHNIIALNISEFNEKFKPTRVPFQDFKQDNPAIAEYFELKVNTIYSDASLLTLKELPLYNLKYETKSKKFDKE
ncbi:hypothetical protein IDJ77_21080 [Mucilaginibacter sp. ZT4R22]|uniref:Uncharacterized protein n=1 Tax=Mucilaginibacter pankratovii TaxID=2772110 RepID=A0ABR7WVJ7_9SPHI|nr:hypothetical protein [Mucilaginibacter pankratovii]MBD1366320.1 hypothetical protein [Mucilaginibacter pankratovii]